MKTRKFVEHKKAENAGVDKTGLIVRLLGAFREVVNVSRTFLVGLWISRNAHRVWIVGQ